MESINDEERHRRVIRRLLAIIAVLVVITALKLSVSVSLPFAFALFLVAVFWPLQRRLEQRIPRWGAVLLTLAAFLLIATAFVSALWWSAESIAAKAPQYADEYNQYADKITNIARGFGFEGSGNISSMAAKLSTKVAEYIAGFAGALVIVVAFFVLALLEVHDYRGKLGQSFDSEGWLDPLHRITADFQRYIAVRTLVGLITGVAVSVFSLLIGLDFAVIWGLINFLLNYIPTLGSIVAVVPPTAFALFQFNGLDMVIYTLLGVGGVQLLMGNYIDPLLQGRYLALSPLAVLFSVVFWGWVWGIAGAFIGVPLTIGVVIACDHFERTRWIARMLAEYRGDPQAVSAGKEPSEPHS